MPFKEIKLVSLELKHFMNVSYGRIPFVEKNRSGETITHVMGIYGQNGSGKTAFIHALAVLKKCLMGYRLDSNKSHDTASYIQIGFPSLELHAVWRAVQDKEPLDIYYDVVVERCGDKNQASAQISAETLSIREAGKRKTKLLCTDGNNLLLPQKVRQEMVSCSGKKLVDFQVQKGIIKSQGRSYLFSDELSEDLQNGKLKSAVSGIDKINGILRDLKLFAMEFFYVIGIEDIGFINLGIMQPFHFRMKKGKRHEFGSIPLPLNGSGKIPDEVYKIAADFFQDENEVLRYLIPGMQIRMKVLNQELDEKEVLMDTVELLSVRNGKEIPLKYESAGIKKILSILQVFIAAYNNFSMIVAIDELDAGVFEYLLGEMVGIFQDGGRGQLIFTSHNLRPLEVLDKRSIIFTTTNPDHRYVHLTNVKANNNLRDVYYRTIMVGGQNERMYQETNRYKLELALRKAGAHAEN